MNRLLNRGDFYHDSIQHQGVTPNCIYTASHVIFPYVSEFGLPDELADGGVSRQSVAAIPKLTCGFALDFCLGQLNYW